MPYTNLYALPRTWLLAAYGGWPFFPVFPATLHFPPIIAWID
jgi:hypothetical protein